MLDLVQSICSSLLCMYAKQSEYREDEHDRNRIYLNLLKKLCSFRCILWLGLAWVGLRIHPALNNFVIFFSIFSLFSSLHVVWSLNRNGLIAKESKCAVKKEEKKNNRGRRRHCCLHKSLCTLRLDISAYSSVSQIPYRKRELKKGQNHREHLRVSCLNIMALMRLWLSCTAAFFFSSHYQAFVVAHVIVGIQFKYTSELARLSDFLSILSFWICILLSTMDFSWFNVYLRGHPFLFFVISIKYT